MNLGPSQADIHDVDKPNPYDLNPWIWERKTLEMAQDLEIAIDACRRIKEQCAPGYLKSFERLEGRFKQLKEQVPDAVRRGRVTNSMNEA